MLTEDLYRILNSFPMPPPEEKSRLFAGIYIAFILVAIMWLAKAIELFAGISFATFGILPLKLKGMAGIVLAPLIHADMGHLTANSAPMLFLTAALVYYYRKNALTILSIIWILTGLLVWLFARGNSYHIGASGVVYGLASFHLMGGILKRDPRLMAFSMLVIFLYGSMVWGFFPDFFPKKNISWESHLMGAISGVVLSIYYRNAGPRARVYDWGEDEDEVEDEKELEEQDISLPNAVMPENQNDDNKSEANDELKPTEAIEPTILYHYKPKGE